MLPGKSNSVDERVEHSCSNLANTFNLTKAALFQSYLHRSGGVLNAPVGSKHVSARLLADSQEMFEVLLQSTEILKLEFSGLEGSGRETLVKRGNALRKTRSVIASRDAFHEFRLRVEYQAIPFRRTLRKPAATLRIGPQAQEAAKRSSGSVWRPS